MLLSSPSDLELKFEIKKNVDIYSRLHGSIILQQLQYEKVEILETYSRHGNRYHTLWPPHPQPHLLHKLKRDLRFRFGVQFNITNDIYRSNVNKQLCFYYELGERKTKSRKYTYKTKTKFIFMK